MEKIWGITVDDPQPLDSVITALNLPKRPTVRLVMDEGRDAHEYANICTRLSVRADLMGLFADSSIMDQYDMEDWKTRVMDYHRYLNSLMTYWEIGNEVNGEWCGNPDDVFRKVEWARDYFRAQIPTIYPNTKKIPLVVTYYLNKWCAPPKAINLMANWMKAFPLDPDIALISYYEEDCGYVVKPEEWQGIFEEFASLLPETTLVGIGEFGNRRTRRAEVIREFYRLPVTHPRYIGGGFYWYYREDCVSLRKPLYKVFQEVWSKE